MSCDVECPHELLFTTNSAGTWRRRGDAGATLGRRWGEAEVCWGRLRIYKEENPKAELRETYLKKHWFFVGTCWASAEHPPRIRRASARHPAGDVCKGYVLQRILCVMSANAIIYKEFCRYLLGIRRASARHLAGVCGTCAVLG